MSVAPLNWIRTYDSYMQGKQVAYQEATQSAEPSGSAVETVPRPAGMVYYAATTAVDADVEYAVALAEDGFVMSAITDIKAHIRQRLGAAVIDFGVEHVDDASESVNFIVLVAKLRDVTRERRHELRKELYQIIAGSTSRDVRERLTVSFR